MIHFFHLCKYWGWRGGWQVITVYIDCVGGGKLREREQLAGRVGVAEGQILFTKKHYFSLFCFVAPTSLSPPSFPLLTCFSHLLPPSQSLFSSFILQGLRLDVIGDPSTS